jgi:hypothetical protein
MATMTVGTANLAADTTVIREAMVRMAAAMVAQAGAVMAKVAATVALVMVEGITAAMVALVTAAGMVMVGRG